MTISEQKFEQFCSDNGLIFKRLEPDGQKTADYEVVLGGQETVVEIKELTLNDDEERALGDLREKRIAAWGPSRIGNRIRYKIDDSKRQLERLAAGKCPAIVLLYDARPIPVRGISPYEILVAMFGFETIDIHLPDNMGEPVRLGKHRFGKGKKLRDDCHTFISGIGVLRETHPEGVLHMDLYQNVFADSPLPLEQLVGRSDITLFTVAPGEANEFRTWARIVSEEEYHEANNHVESDEG